MRLIIGILLTLVLFAGPSFSQNKIPVASAITTSPQDSCDISISLITCGPGEELYSLFGHSAIRVKQPSAGIDIIYNYGTFDFEDPDFYAKFTKGSLLYFVSTEPFSDFLYQYQYENRYVIEQVLNLSCDEKKRLFSALQVNAKEENKYYRYDFVLDNCSTRPRDIISQNTNDSVVFNNYLPNPLPTYRNLLHEYLNKGNQPWSKFGIDLILGSKVDKSTSNFTAMFLPDYLMKAFDSASLGKKSIIASKTLISRWREMSSGAATEIESQTAARPRVDPPFILFSILAALITLLSFLKPKSIQNILTIFDIIFFLFLGVIGCLILFMWFGSNYALCNNNYNILWALPTHLPIAFVLFLNKSWIKKYFTICTIIYVLVIIAWKFLPQGMNYAFFPIVFTAGIRSFFRAKK